MNEQLPKDALYEWIPKFPYNSYGATALLSALKNSVHWKQGEFQVVNNKHRTHYTIIYVRQSNGF